MRKSVILYAVITIAVFIVLCVAYGTVINAQEVINELQTRNQTMASQLNDYKNTMNDMNQTMSDVLKSTQESLQQIKTLNNQITQFKEEIETLTNENKQLQEENRLLKEERGIVYDISLSSDLQQYTFEKCVEYDLDYEFILAVMYAESSYNINAINYNKNGTYDIGLMQINSCNKSWLTTELGITDFFNAKNNIDAGCYYFGSLFKNYGKKGEHYVLMAYNMGKSRVDKLYSTGTYSSTYSRKIMNIKNNLLEFKTIAPV